MSQYIVLASNSSRKVTAIGTRYAKAFESEEAAERAKKKMERKAPSLDFLVLPICEPYFP